jgi:hypothetical protein
MREELWNIKEELIGKSAKIKYCMTGDYKVPRFPVFVGIREE